MNPEGKQKLKDVFETTDMYFRFLHLGYFFDEFARKNNMSINVKKIRIPLKEDGYFLNENILKDMLNDIYQTNSPMNVFNYLVLFNTLRGVSGAIREGFGSDASRLPSQEELRDKFKEDVLEGDSENFESFEGIIRLIRNVLSHNIEDRIFIQEADIAGQKNYWLNTLQKSRMDFIYDYSKTNSTINVANYSLKCEISIDWNQVQEGKLFGNLISSFQFFMLIEFCRNALYLLYNRYK